MNPLNSLSQLLNKTIINCLSVKKRDKLKNKKYFNFKTKGPLILREKELLDDFAVASKLYNVIFYDSLNIKYSNKKLFLFSL